ncbi:MAG: type I-U CRISPR-associated protein Cas5/Cas6, partial [Chloroflexi bacterium]|nr:type I-U CRISPR-associated protein Cas5/Cas6 [Chloroflexota bacterium]
SMKDACEHIGLPRPTELLLHPTSLVQGIPISREFARIPRNRNGGQRRHAHAVIIFDQPVRGPVMIGAGRFRGYGLCRPVDNEG